MTSQSVEIFRGAATSMVLKSFGALFQFLMTIVISRKLGAAAAGVFFLSMTIINIISVGTRFGTDNYLVKKVSEYNSKGNIGLCLEYVDAVLSMILIVSLLTAILLWILSPILAIVIFRKPELQEVLRLMSILVVFLSIGLAVSFALQGFKMIFESVSIQNVISPLVTICIAFLLIQNYQIKGAVWAYSAGVFTATLYGWVILRRYRANIPTMQRSKTVRWGKIWTECKPFYILSIMNQIIAWTPLLVLGVFSKSDQVGIFQAVYRTAILVSFALIAANSIIAPKLAEFKSLGQLDLMKESVEKVTFLLFLMALPVAALFIFFSRKILLVFGPEYTAGSIVFQVLVLGQLFNVLAGPVYFLLTMTGHVSAACRALVLSSVVGIILNLILTPLLGIMGAGLASAITLVFQNVIAMIEVKTKLGFVCVPKPKFLVPVLRKFLNF